MKQNFKDFKANIKNKHVAIVGLGISNTPLINFLLKFGCKITLFDKKNIEEFTNYEIKNFNKLNIKFVFGKNYLNYINNFDYIFKTPSIRPDIYEFENAKKNGCIITSEIEELLKYCPSKIYGVTGSDGKTTTTTILYNLFKISGYKTWLGGNIGIPLFEKIEQMNEDHKVVLELSSFQLMNTTVSPDVSIITNISPNHLDYHKDMNEYIECKKNIFKFQNESNTTILNDDCENTKSFENEIKSRIRKFSLKKNVPYEIIENGAYLKDNELYVLNQRLFSKNDMKIKGEHNLSNFAAAILATIPEVSSSTIKEFAKNFSGVKHRNEFVDTINNIHFYNDSIASSPTRTLATLSCFDRKVILIAGGYDKNISYTPLINGVNKIKKLYLIGSTKQKIYDVFKKYTSDIEILIFDDFKDLIFYAYNNAKENDIILLSPASASFDMFKNFEDRGDTFKNIVKSIKASN